MSVLLGWAIYVNRRRWPIPLKRHKSLKGYIFTGPNYCSPTPFISHNPRDLLLRPNLYMVRIVMPANPAPEPFHQPPGISSVRAGPSPFQLTTTRPDDKINPDAEFSLFHIYAPASICDIFNGSKKRPLASVAGPSRNGVCHRNAVTCERT